MIDYTKHLSKYDDLITTYAETRAGFISIALEKNRRATPYVEEARILNAKIIDVVDPNEFLNRLDIRNGLIAASGISEKAANHLGEEGCKVAITEFIRNFLIPAGEKFKEELVFRFLLTRGDSLGGSMRNIVGALAQKKLCLAIVSSLRLAGRQFEWFDDNAKKWIASDTNANDIEVENAKGLFWLNLENQSRLLLFNLGVPIVKNNIDIVLFNSPITSKQQLNLGNPALYIALGELKGGIDPAGADEHWKTAKTALDRIVDSFELLNHNPHVFYIGAAIENKMASEIYNLLIHDYLKNAGNLTKPDHIISIAEWLLCL